MCTPSEPFRLKAKMLMEMPNPQGSAPTNSISALFGTSHQPPLFGQQITTPQPPPLFTSPSQPIQANSLFPSKSVPAPSSFLSTASTISQTAKHAQQSPSPSPRPSLAIPSANVVLSDKATTLPQFVKPLLPKLPTPSTKILANSTATMQQDKVTKYDSSAKSVQTTLPNTPALVHKPFAVPTLPTFTSVLLQPIKSFTTPKPNFTLGCGATVSQRHTIQPTQNFPFIPSTHSLAAPVMPFSQPIQTAPSPITSQQPTYPTTPVGQLSKASDSNALDGSPESRTPTGPLLQTPMSCKMGESSTSPEVPASPCCTCRDIHSVDSPRKSVVPDSEIFKKPELPKSPRASSQDMRAPARLLNFEEPSNSSCGASSDLLEKANEYASRIEELNNKLRDQISAVQDLKLRYPITNILLTLQAVST